MSSSAGANPGADTPGRPALQERLTGLGWLTSFPFAVLTVLLLRVVWTCRDEIAEPDIWWHLLNGRFLWLHGRLPAFDSYSFTVPGVNWLDHQWLSEAIYYAAYSAGGLQGVFAAYTAALCLLITLIFLASFETLRDPLVAGFLTAGGMLLAMVGFGPRTQTFGWICFAAMYLLLRRFRAGRRTGEIWAIPAIFVLWINLHGSWIAGLIVYAIFFLCGLRKRDIGRFEAAPYTPDEIKLLLRVGLLSVCALFLNPVGYRLLNYPFDMLFNQSVNTSHIEEWEPARIEGLRGQFIFLTLAVVFIAAAAGRRRWRIEDVLLAGFAVYCGLSHIRFLMLTGIVLPPILAEHVGRWSSYRHGRERRILNACLVLGMCIWSAALFPSGRKLWGDVEHVFPAAALRSVPQLHDGGRLFNRYEWGGYIEWSHPELKVFIDSRTDIFEYYGVLQDYLRIEEMKDSLRLLAHYNIRYVLESPSAPLSYLLAHNAGWREIYRDEQAQIFEACAGTSVCGPAGS